MSPDVKETSGLIYFLDLENLNEERQSVREAKEWFDDFILPEFLRQGKEYICHD